MTVPPGILAYIGIAICVLMVLGSVPLILREAPPRSSLAFGAAFTLMALALLVSLTSISDTPWLRIVQNTLFCAALTSLWAGAWLRAGYPPDKILFGLLAAVWMVPNLVFNLLIPNVVLRVLGAGAAIVVGVGCCAWKLWHKQAVKNAGDLLLMAWFVVVGLVVLGVVLASLSGGQAVAQDGVNFYLVALPILCSGLGLFLFESFALDSIDEMERQARTDTLTGLMNRRAFDEELTTALARAKRYRRPLAIVMADIDLFKSINDRYGHPFGDRVIRDFAHMLKEETREVDTIARIGGEEFAVVMPEIDVAQAALLAERLRRATETLVIRDAGLTASFGVSDTAHSDYSGSALIQDADGALYKAKHAGRNRVEVAGVIGAPMRARPDADDAPA